MNKLYRDFSENTIKLWGDPGRVLLSLLPIKNFYTKKQSICFVDRIFIVYETYFCWSGTIYTVLM
jgi:hypothetical protein